MNEEELDQFSKYTVLTNLDRLAKSIAGVGVHEIRLINRPGFLPAWSIVPTFGEEPRPFRPPLTPEASGPRRQPTVFSTPEEPELTSCTQNIPWGSSRKYTERIFLTK